MEKYGSFLERLVAGLIDFLILYVPVAFIKNEDLSQVIFLVLSPAYFVWMNGTYGATIGKMVMKLKITREDGSKIFYSDALLREIASYLSTVVLFLGYLNVIWDSKKQGWHDKIAHTIVVKV